MRNLKEKFKDFKEKFEKGYGTVKISGLPIFSIIAVLMIMAGAYIYQLIYKNNLGVIGKGICIYLVALFAALALLVSGSYLYMKQKNSHKQKMVKCIYAIFTVALFFFITSPLLIVLWIARYVGIQLGSYFRMEHIFKYILAVMLSSTIYLIEFMICIFNWSTMLTYNFLEYILFVLVVHIIGRFIRWIIEKIYVNGNFGEKYAYKHEIRILQLQVINTMTLLTGVGGLFLSHMGNEWSSMVYIMMPWVIFSGFEQMALVSSKRTEEERVFIKMLYEEMLLLKDVAVPQIKSYSSLKIRVKLSVDAYIIEYQKNYIISFKRLSVKKQKLVENTLNSMKVFLLDEYSVYEDKEVARFLADVNFNINNLAECLLKI
ncbi:MAG: hypothetical protein ACI33I_09140 [Clostridium sp.]